MRGGLPRANAVKYVHEKYGVNLLTCICAIDKATLDPLMKFWVPEVEVGAVHELIGNALIMRGEKADRTDMRGVPFNEKGDDPELPDGTKSEGQMKKEEENV
jgi:hypothetical protein